MTITPALLASLTFLGLTGVGYLAQVLKLLRRDRACKAGKLPQDKVCDGLLPFREFVSFTAFLLFGLSGATRPNLDVVLVGTRFPVILLAVFVLGILARYGAVNARLYFRLALVGAALFLVTVSLQLNGVSFADTVLPMLIDKVLAVVSLFLFFSKGAQARQMFLSKRTAAVSWFREIGLVAKDLSGLWYAYSVGSELFWVGFTHVLSALSSGLICCSKLVVERTLSSRKATD